MLFDTKKNLKLSILPSIYFTIFGLSLQIGKSFLIMKNEPPTIDFIIKASIVYYLVSFFFCFGFFTFQDAIPGKSRFKRAFRYSLYAYLAVLLPGIIGVIAFDFKGGTYLFSPEKINDYAITLSDTITFILGGISLGFFIKDKDSSSPYKFTLKLLFSCIIGAVVYPLVQLLINLMVVQFIDYGYTVPNEMKLFHFASLYGTLILTGSLLPVLFSVAKELDFSFKRSPIRENHIKSYKYNSVRRIHFFNVAASSATAVASTGSTSIEDVLNFGSISFLPRSSAASMIHLLATSVGI